MTMHLLSKRWIRLGLFLLLGIGIVAVYSVWKFQRMKAELFGFQPPEMALAQYTPKDVLGDLGGMKVRIPRHYAEYVEYDGDPGWGEKRKGPRPERTFDSKLRSFGIEFRFPDMRGLDSREMREEALRLSLTKDKPWMSLGVRSGSLFPGTGFLDRRAKATLPTTSSPKYAGHWLFTYERWPDEHGLEVWKLSGINPKTERPARETDFDIYLHRSSSGNVDAWARCYKASRPEGISSCMFSFSLEPRSRTVVEIRFASSHLFRWREIKRAATDLLLGFEVESK